MELPAAAQADRPPQLGGAIMYPAGRKRTKAG